MTGRGFLIPGISSGLIAMVMPRPEGLNYRHVTFRSFRIVRFHVWMGRPRPRPSTFSGIQSRTNLGGLVILSLKAEFFLLAKLRYNSVKREVNLPLNFVGYWSTVTHSLWNILMLFRRTYDDVLWDVTFMNIVWGLEQYWIGRNFLSHMKVWIRFFLWSQLPTERDASDTNNRTLSRPLTIVKNNRFSHSSQWSLSTLLLEILFIWKPIGGTRVSLITSWCGDGRKETVVGHTTH